MTRVLNWLTVLLLLASLWLRTPLLFLLAMLLGLVAGLTALWGRYALAGITYTRRVETPRLFVGEETDLWVEIVNAKPLPLAWLKAEDEFPEEVDLLRGTLHAHYKPGRRMLVNLVSLGFYERVRKRYPLRAGHRGALEFGPVKLRAGDVFGFRDQQQELAQTDLMIVYPRVVPVTSLGLPAAHPFGDAKAPRRLAEDPLRVGSVRPYLPGDNPRFLHWKATARRGELQTKVFDPSASPSTAIFLDVRTVADGPGVIEDYLEYGISAAASVARFVLDSREAVGLYANGSWRMAGELTVRLPPSRRPGHWLDILDALARLSGLYTTDMGRWLHAQLPSLPFGATVVVISAVVTEALSAVLLDARRAGHPVLLLAIGDKRPVDVPEGLPLHWIGGHEAYQQLAALGVEG